MKKLFFAALMAVAVSASAFAADTKVSSSVLSSFHNKFRNASNVEWKITTQYTKAMFTQNDQKVEAFYSVDGDFVGTSKAISIADLPEVAKKAFDKTYEGYTVNEVIFFEGNEESAYFISASNAKGSVVLKVDEAGSITTVK